MGKPELAIGTMSGTSMDAIDVAAIVTDGNVVCEFGPARSYPYSERERARLAEAMACAQTLTRRSDRPPPLDEIEGEITSAHARAINRFIDDTGVARDQVRVIGFHGQSVVHRPDEGLTVQLGDGAGLADMTSIDVVADFRAADVAAGGQGAPLAPVFHCAISSHAPALPVAFVNIGGIANITYVDQDHLIAFDCGPGNALIDDWMRTTSSLAFDKDGDLARQGTIDAAALAAYMRNPWFAKRPPKSLDRGDFSFGAVAGLNPADGAATLGELTALAISHAGEWLPGQAQMWIVCGGGRRNRFIMERLAYHVSGAVAPAEALGLDGDAIEAQAFAYLAMRTLAGLPLTYPQTTGVAAPTCGGVLFAPAGGKSGGR